MPRGRPRKDVTGQQFGRWTVLSVAYVKGGHSHWLCRCQCGTESAIDITRLQNGGSKSCGCLRREIRQRYLKIGDAFGRWTVIASASNRGKATYWLCRCACGTEREVVTAGLLQNKTRSCGCYQREVVAAMNQIPKPLPQYCRKNHEMNPENIYLDPHGVRRCRICMRLRDRRRAVKRKDLKRVYAEQYRRENRDFVNLKQRLGRQRSSPENRLYDRTIKVAYINTLDDMFPGAQGYSRTGRGIRSGWWTPNEDSIVLRTDISLREMCRLLEQNGTPRTYRGVGARRSKLITGISSDGRPLRFRSRPAYGEFNNSVKLTADDVLTIRESCLSQRQLADNYGVSQSMISKIKQRQNWKHLP